MVVAPRRAPSASIATAACTCLWVSTPTMTPARAVSSMAEGLRAGCGGLAIRRSDRTVTGRSPSSSYQVTSRSIGRCRPEAPTRQRDGTGPVKARVRPPGRHRYSHSRGSFEAPLADLRRQALHARRTDLQRGDLRLQIAPQNFWLTHVLQDKRAYGFVELAVLEQLQGRDAQAFLKDLGRARAVAPGR